MTSDKNNSKPFKEDQAKERPKLKETSDVEAKLAALEAEVAAKRVELNVPPPSSDLPVPVKAPKAEKEKKKAASKSSGDGINPAHINMAAFWTIAIVSILLSNVPGIHLLMTPINQFVVMVHESSHAIVTFLTGGFPVMTTVSDGLGHSGITQSNGGWLFLSAQAGYLGTTLFGCLLVYLSQFHKYSKQILMGLGGLIILLSLIFITPAIFNISMVLSGILSMMWGFFLGLSCIYMGKKLSPMFANLVLLFLAIQTALNSITLAWVLVPNALGLAGSAFSDATIMAQYFFIPAIFWALWWILLSLVMLFLTFRFTYGKAFFRDKKKKS